QSLSFRGGPKLRNPFQQPIAPSVVFDPLAAPLEDAETVAQIRFLCIWQRTVLERSGKGVEVARQRFGIGSIGSTRAAVIVCRGLFFVDSLVYQSRENLLLLFRIPDMPQHPKVTETRGVPAA